MSALEQEIIEKFHLLQPAEKRRVRALIEQEIEMEPLHAESSSFDYTAWARDVDSIRQQIRAGLGNKQSGIDVVGMLRDIRDGEDE